MKNLKKNRWALSAAALLLTMVTPAVVGAAEVSSAGDADVRKECSRELLMVFFPESIVKGTLKKYNVPESKWDGITKSLAAKDRNIMKDIEDSAGQMSPNPIRDPQVRVKMLREKLLQVFTAAMSENGMTDSSQFQAMVDEIQKEKVNKYQMCLQTRKPEMMKESSGAAAMKGEEENDDDTDADDDEEDGYDDEEDDNDQDDSDDNDLDDGDEEEDESDGDEEEKPAQKNGNGKAPAPKPAEKK